MNKLKTLVASLVIANMAFISNAYADETKNEYHLFNPTPKEKMRGLNTDRPDKTESPITVDAGHFQFETDFATYVRDQNKDEVSESILFNYINLKAGITNNIDFQLLVPSYSMATTQSAGKVSSVGGFGDITARLKINLWGNDEDNAIGLLPFAKLPTATNDLGNKYVEGGVIVPMTFSLPYDFSLGAMVVWNYVRNDANSNYENTITTSASLGHQIVDNMGVYFELFSDKNLHNSSWVATFDTGITYEVAENVQLDWGMNIGLTPEADDFNPFMGLSVLF